MICGRESQIRSPHTSSCDAKAFEGLRRRDLVDQVSVNPNQAGSVGLFVNNMALPDLFEKCPGSHCGPTEDGIMRFRLEKLAP